MPRVGAVIDAVHARFQAADLYYGHGTDNSWDEAVALVLGVTEFADDDASLQLTLTADQADEIERLAGLRIDERQPLAYLLGKATYLGLEFHLPPGVVVPRSPLGFLLPDGIRPWLADDVTSILDLCTGSGCLGIAAALMYPEATAELVDLDPLACATAQQNVDRYGLADRVTVTTGDVTTMPLPAADLILCNPPYVNALDMRGLPPEYRYEPEQGLAAGDDGLAVLLPLLDRAGEILKPQGVLLAEVGASAPALVRALPDLPLIWLDLPQGGEGVFLLEASALNSHTARQH
ncbi:MAG: 50S ribosomal protein L3 N(5)-glutamine methyltransferase [Pseudomonadales bacterium]